MIVAFDCVSIGNSLLLLQKKANACNKAMPVKMETGGRDFTFHEFAVWVYYGMPGIGSLLVCSSIGSADGTLSQMLGW